MDGRLEEDPAMAVERAEQVTTVLAAIDHLLDAIDQMDAPITRELLRTAMMALVHEFRLAEVRDVPKH